MKITKQVVKGLHVISLEGDLVMGKTNELYSQIIPLIEKDDKIGVILNCQEVKYVDSSGLGMVVNLFKALQKQKMEFAICNVNEQVNELFSLTRLDRIISITKDIDSSLLEIQKKYHKKS